LPLPLQNKPREPSHSVFVYDDLNVYPDQWAFLASIEPMSSKGLESTLLLATGPVQPLDVAFVDDEDLATPWKRPAPNNVSLPGPLPEALTITLANLVYFEGLNSCSVSNHARSCFCGIRVRRLDIGRNTAVVKDIQRHRALVAALCRRDGARRLDLSGSATRDDLDAQVNDLDFLTEP
jgi:hypothetical protein